MATKLTIISETHYKNLEENSTDTDKASIESYTEDDTIKWMFEEYCKLLLATGYSREVIQKYLNYDGSEVWEIDE